MCRSIRIGVGLEGKLTDLSWFLVWNAAEMALGKFGFFLWGEGGNPKT